MMKNLFKKVTLALVMLAMTFSMAIAKNRSEKVSFSRDMVVNGTVVKKGTYKVTYDDQSKEMAIWDGKNELTKMAVRSESRTRKPSSTEVIFTEKDNQSVLNSITFAGSAEALIVSEKGNGTATPQ
jgi:hypothetical protein